MLKSRSIISYVLIALVLSLSVAYFVLPKTEAEDTPPTLQIAAKNKFKGYIGGDEVCNLGGLYKFTAEKVNAYTAPNLDAGQKYDLTAGEHLYHADQDMTVEQIFKNIEPVEGNKVLLAYYNPVNNANKVFSLYPEIPGQTNITNPAQFTIPAHQGFLILSCKDAKIWQVKNEKAPGLLPAVADTMQDGWLLFAAPDDFKLNAQALATKIKSVYVQKGPGFDFIKKYPPEVAYAKLKFFPEAAAFGLGETMLSIPLTDDLNMVWIKFGTPTGQQQGNLVAPSVSIPTAAVETYSAASGLTPVTFTYKIEGSVEPLDKFVYDWKSEGSIEEVNASTLELNKNLTKVHNFPAGATYDIEFRLLSDTGTVKSKSIKSVTIPAAPATPPSAPAKPNVFDLEKTSAKVSWEQVANPGSQPVTKYTISVNTGQLCLPVGDKANLTFSVEQLKGKYSNTEITGLSPNTDYNVHIRVTNSTTAPYVWVDGPCEKFTTLADPADPLATTPAAPAAPILSEKTATSVKVSWQKPASAPGKEVALYSVVAQLGSTCTQPGQNNISKMLEVSKIGANLTETITGLAANTDYMVYVAAGYDALNWSYSPCSPLKTNVEPPAAPAGDGKITGFKYEGFTDAKDKTIFEWNPYTPVDPISKPVSGFAIQHKLSSTTDWPETWSNYLGQDLTSAQYPKDKKVAEVLENGKTYDFRIAPSTIGPYLNWTAVLNDVKIEYKKDTGGTKKKPKTPPKAKKKPIKKPPKPY